MHQQAIFINGVFGEIEKISKVVPLCTAQLDIVRQSEYNEEKWFSHDLVEPLMSYSQGVIG